MMMMNQCGETEHMLGCVHRSTYVNQHPKTEMVMATMHLLIVLHFAIFIFKSICKIAKPKLHSDCENGVH